MPVLGIDIETYSSVDLRNTTVYRYVESPDFSILLFAYAVDDEPVKLVDLTREKLPVEVLQMLVDPGCIKVAYNANFERVCLSEWMKRNAGLKDGYLDPEQWRCTMVHAATLGLPRTLGEVGAVLGLPEDKQKMKEGKALIQYFCKPCKPTKTNHQRTRNLPEHDPEKWRVFCDYNVRDVETEREIRRMLEAFPVIDEEWAAYWLDQRINDRGVKIDKDLMNAAIHINYEHAAELVSEAQGITGLGNVNSVAQIKSWIGHAGSLNKKTVQQLRQGGELTASQDRVLAIRQELGKTSVSKYEAMQRGVCLDGRVKGLFSFYGANRTGRWAGRQVQVQNLPQNHIPDLEAAREVVKDRDRDGLQALYGNVPATLSELIRTAFIAKEGHTFVVADFNAIEARVVAWLADEQWRLENFRRGGDIYCASASRMFGVPVEKNGVNGHLRQKGKIAELALGYGGGVGAMTSMGALEMGLKEEELQPIVEMWRESNARIVELWWQIDKAAREVIGTRCPDWIRTLPHGLSMRMSGKLLHLRLPSGRCLRYWMPKLEHDGYRENITYGSVEAGKWGRVETYGPKLVENITQAVARDCLRDAMLEVAKTYPGIVMHIHDEMVVEVPKEQADTALKDILTVMARGVDWAPGLLLKGAGYITKFYRKD
jgi:DNA polymerase